MSFKHHCLLALILLASGCSLRLNDKVNNPVTSVNTGSGCLAKAGDVLDRFTKGTLSEPEHNDFYACLDRALSTLADHTTGEAGAAHGVSVFGVGR